MTKKITITLCAIIIGLSTVFIAQNTVKAEETGNINVIEYPSIPFKYAPEYISEQGYTDTGLTGKYIENINALYFKGTIEESKTTNLYMGLTDKIDIIPNSTYSIYIYSTCKNNNVWAYSNDYGQGMYFINKFYKITTNVNETRFYIAFSPDHTENAYQGYYTFMMWQGDWELNADIVNSLKYQIGYNEGKIEGYKNGYNKGSTDGYNKGIEEGLNANASNNYIFNYLKDWNCSVRYGESLSNNRGTFKLTSDNKSIYASGYYPLIKNDTNDNTEPYWLFFMSNQESKKFEFGYKDLIFKGLPENTCFYVTLNINGKDYASFCWIGKDGKWFSYDPIFKSGKYEEDTYLKSFIIECKTAVFTNGNQTSANIFDLRNYPNFVITAEESMIVSSAYQNGYNNAKDFYYNNWYIGRYQQGYNEGAKNAGNYTFLSLMGSVVDAPIKAISDMLNFEILGFNMMQFFYAIITVCIIVTIVKLLL